MELRGNIVRLIKELREGERIIEHYLCKEKQSRETQKGKTYYSLKLRDKSGMIEAKVWELSTEIQAFDEGDMIKIDGYVLSYQNELQIKVTKLRRSNEGEYTPSDYVATTDKNIDEMYSQLVDIIKSIENVHLRTLLENILIKDEAKVALLKSHSAAKNMHHSYMGGLLEHTLAVTQISDFISVRYRYVNRDLTIAGAILHDIGKIYELSPPPQNEYTNEGQLLGHIVIGVELITEEVAKIEGFPTELATLLKHSIVSHHGEYEFGSPKLPSIPEAMILHYADNMDAKLKIFEEAFDVSTSVWTGYHRSMGRYLRKSEF